MTPQDKAWLALGHLHGYASQFTTSADVERIDDYASRLRAYLRNEPYWGAGDPPKTEDK